MSNNTTKHLRVALVHDFFFSYGGAERVVEQLHSMFPDAPVYTAFVNKESLGVYWNNFSTWDIRVSWAQRIPLLSKTFSVLRVISDKFFSSFDLSMYDVVISSTNMYMAKAVRTKPPTIHICYCHTPPRSLYGYSTMSDWKKNPIIRLGGALLNHYLRIVDVETSKNPDVFIANSKEVQRRIQKFYKRESIVINPPIDVPKTLQKTKKKDFILYVGRIGLSKHTDLVVKACTKLGKTLIVAGTGKSVDHIKTFAGETVTFLGPVSDEKLRQLYTDASLLIYPAEDEDFGMVPVEAMGYGTPVIVHRSGGFLETVIEGKTGYFINTFTVEELSKVIAKAQKTQWSQEFLHTHALKYSKDVFDKKIKALIGV